MGNFVDEGALYISEGNITGACDVWFKVWEAIKYRWKPDKPEFRDLEFLDKQYSGRFFTSNLCQDLEGELHNAGLHDSTYFEKRIDYCREFLNLFPDTDELIIHNMRRAIGDSYSCLGDYEQAESEFEKLVQDYPDNPWGYIGWGDIYFLDKKGDFDKAKTLYMKALAIAEHRTDILAVQERLEDLEYAIGTQQLAVTEEESVY